MAARPRAPPRPPGIWEAARAGDPGRPSASSAVSSRISGSTPAPLRAGRRSTAGARARARGPPRRRHPRSRRRRSREHRHVVELVDKPKASSGRSLLLSCRCPSQDRSPASRAAAVGERAPCVSLLRLAWPCVTGGDAIRIGRAQWVSVPVAAAVTEDVKRVCWCRVDGEDENSSLAPSQRPTGQSGTPNTAALTELVAIPMPVDEPEFTHIANSVLVRGLPRLLGARSIYSATRTPSRPRSSAKRVYLGESDARVSGLSENDATTCSSSAASMPRGGRFGSSKSNGQWMNERSSSGCASAARRGDCERLERTAGDEQGHHRRRARRT